MKTLAQGLFAILLAMAAVNLVAAVAGHGNVLVDVVCLLVFAYDLRWIQRTIRDS